MKEDANPFRLLRSLGYYHIVPIIPPGAVLSERSSLYKRLHNPKKPRDERGKVPGICRNGEWFSYAWQKDHEPEPEFWHSIGAGVGIKPGPVFDEDGNQLPGHLMAIDADTYAPEHAAIVERTLDKHLGKDTPKRIGRPPKALYVVRTDEDFRQRPIIFGDKDENGQRPNRVEFLTKDRQFIARGIHPKTMQPYKWVRPLVAAKNLPFVPAAKMREIVQELIAALPDADLTLDSTPRNATPVPPEKRRASLELVREALQALPNTPETHPHRDDYILVMYATRGALPEHPNEAYDLLEEWALRYEDNTPDSIRDDWDGITNEPYSGFNVLLAEFRRVGNEDMAARLLARHSFDAVEAEKAIRLDEDAKAAKNHAPLFPENLPKSFEQDGAAKFVFEPFYEAAGSALTSAAAPLIKGLLDQGAMSVVYGQSNVGKTFITVDVGYHVAAGLPYGGMKTTQGHVVYLSAEGGRSITKRLSALCVKHGTAADVAFHLLRSTIDLRRPDADLKPLAAAIKGLGVPVALIVVDTLSRALAGGDENSSVDMGQIVSNFDKLREFTGAHLMIVHHSGKNQAAGARGHSLLRAATDTEIEVSEGVIEAKKQRDLDKNWSSAFMLDVHTLGVDSDGDPVTSCTVRLVGRDSVEARQMVPLTPAEEKVAKAVLDLDHFDGDGVGAADLADFLRGKMEDVSLNAIRHLLKQLVQKGVVEKIKRGRWVLTDSPPHPEEVAETVPPLREKDNLYFEQVAESGGRSGGSVFQ